MTRSFPGFLRSLASLMAGVVVAGCSQEASLSRSMDRARGFFEAGEHEKAKLEYLSIVRKDRENAEAIRQVGLIWSLQGGATHALPFFEKARDMGQLPDELRPRLMLALALNGQIAEAREEAREILQRIPGHSQTLFMLADMARQPEEIAAFHEMLAALPNSELAGHQAAMALSLLRSGRVIEAKEAAAKALTLDPKAVEAHLAQAAVQLADKDLPAAEKSITTASELAPLRSYERLRLAEFKKQHGKSKEARTLVDAVVQQAPDYMPALLLSARLSREAEADEETLATLEKIFAIDPLFVQARLLQVDMLMENNGALQAVEVLERLDHLFGDSMNIRLRLAKAQMQAGQLTEAEDVLNQILAKNPEAVEASLLLANVQLRSGNPAAVVPAMAEVLENHPNSETAALQLVVALEAQRRLEEAIRVMRRLSDHRPENALYRAQLGQLLAQAGQSEEARATYEKVLEVVPDDLAAVSRLIDLDLIDGKMEEALQRAQALRERHPKAAVAAFTEARVHVVKEDWVPAEASLLKTLELDPGHVVAHDFLARLYITNKRLPEATRIAEKWLEIDPKAQGALRLLALCYTDLGDFAKTAEAYEKLLVVLPQPDPQIMNNLAVIYSEYLGNLDRAYELAQQAHTLQPSVMAAATRESKRVAASIADTMGRLHYRRGEYAKAYESIQEAVGHLSTNPEVQAHFGLAAAAMGQAETAREALAMAVAAPDDFPAKEEARERLALVGEETTASRTSAELASLAQKSPDDPLVQLWLAEALENESKHAEAATAYAAALTANPDLAPAALGSAKLHAGPLNDGARALEMAKKARALAPKDPHAAAVLGNLVYRGGEHSWAYDLLLEATRGGAGEVGPLLDLARAAYSVGRVEEARTAMRQVLESSPEPAIATEATSFLELTATPPPSEVTAEEALKNQANNVPALMVRGAAQIREGEAAAAAATYREILNVYPNFSPARKHLAAVLARDPASRLQAYELALQARETLRDDPDLAETIAMLTYHRGDYAYAVELFTEAARIRPPQAEALYYMGLAQLALKEDVAGLDSLNRALAAGLSGPEAEEAARRLHAGKE